MLTALWFLLALLVLGQIAKRGRRFLYDGYNFDASESGLSTNVTRLAESFRLPDRRGKGVDASLLKKYINSAMRAITKKVRRGETLYEFERWLYDNHYLYLRNYDKVKSADFAALPHIGGQPRVVALARVIVDYTNDKPTAENLNEVIKITNGISPLTVPEINALSLALSFALLEKIANISKKAYYFYVVFRAALKGKNIAKKYLTSNIYRRYVLKYNPKLAARLETIIGKNGESYDNIDYTFSMLLVENNVVAAAATSSLRDLGEITKDVFDRSRAAETLSRDDDFLRFDAATKRAYADELARQSDKINVDEGAFAERLLEMQKLTGEHFGCLMFRHKKEVARFVKDGKLPVLAEDKRVGEKLYVAAVMLLSAAFGATIGWSTLSPVRGVFAAVAGFFAALPPSVALVNRISGLFAIKKTVMRTAYEDVPDNAKTVTLMPVYIDGEPELRKSLTAIKRLQATNDYKNAEFALLLDFKSAKTETCASDEILLNVLKDELKGFERVSAFVRKRTLCGDRYSGYERKRGAVEQFVEYLVTQNTDNFVYVSKKLENVKFAVVLDADNTLMPQAVLKAVNAFLHPMNSKYDLLAFSAKTNMFSVSTPYSKRFVRGGGVENYPEYGDLYYNLCGNSIFSGKGIFKVDAFYKKLRRRLPEGRVLSHDIIEGALLETGSAGVTTYEDAPATFTAEYARRTRWARGDLQLLPFIGYTKNDENCSKIALIYRFIIFFNAISVLYYPIIFALACAGVFAKLPFLTLSAFALTAAEPAVVIVGALFSPINGVRIKCALSAIGQSVSDLIGKVSLTPFYAFGGLKTAVATLYKMSVAKSGLLEWKPYCSRENADSREYAKLFMPSVVLAAFVTVMSYYTPYFLYCAAYFSVFVACALSTAFSGVNRAAAGIKDETTVNYLSEIAARTYAYFVDFTKDGLVADNFQVAPKGIAAGYTSPTNIGYSVIAHLSAYALKLIDKNTAEKRVSETLSAVEKLEKWHGHLYNWYDLKTKRPLPPAFVSSVDSGNLTAALITAGELLGGNIKIRVDDYLEKLDFSALYDKNKRQLYIGYNTKEKKYEGHYDNLISESRLLVYTAVASGVPVCAWNSLSRDASSVGGGTLLSWSGTVFEYMMSELFLDTPEKSLIGKSCANAVSAFKKEKCAGFWGISESGCFEIDDCGNYKYRAFGIDNLSLKSELSSCVISPYSSFLCLEKAEKAVLKNLKKLEKADAYNRYGFFESLDCTGAPRLTLEYMAHHQGMIMAAIANALDDDVLKRAFNADRKIAGAKLLLAESPGRLRAGKPEKNRFVYKEKPTEKFCVSTKPHAQKPIYNILQNGGYGILIDDSGRGYSIVDGVAVGAFQTVGAKDYGAFFYVDDGKSLASPTLAPLYADGGYKTEFTSDRAEFINGNLSQSVYAPSFFNGELRRLKIKNDSLKSKTYKIAFYTELCLNGFDAALSHRAFSNLFFDTKKRDGKIYAVRKGSEKNVSDCAVMLVTGAERITYTTNRFNFIGRSGSLKNPDGLRVFRNDDDFGTVLEPCFAFVAAVTVAPNSERVVDVAIAYGKDEETAEKEIRRAESKHFAEFTKTIPYVLAIDGNRGLSSGSKELLSKLVGKLLYEPYSQQKIMAICKNHAKFVEYSDNFTKKLLLFKFDVSQTKRLGQAAAIVKLLNRMSIKTALLVSYKEGDCYYEPVKKAVNDVVDGVIGRDFFVVPESELTYDELKSFAFYDFSDSLVQSAERDVCPTYVKSLEAECDPSPTLTAGEGYFEKDGYVVNPFGVRTMLPYSNAICGEKGGTLVTDNGGYTYYSNSRENKLTFWSNDAVTDFPGETLTLSDESGIMRLNGGENVKITHKRGLTESVFTADDFTAVTSQYIVDGGKIKIYETEITAKKAVFKKLTLKPHLVLGAYGKPFCVHKKTENGVIVATNLKNGVRAALKTFGGAADENDFSCSYEVALKACEKAVFYFALGGDVDATEALKLGDISAKKKESTDYFDNLNRFSIETDNAYLDELFNNWLMYQIVSCRINGRTSFYQAGGAIGFRDQLQDCLALVYSDASKARKLILEIAKHTYCEGDVMHWWHGEKHGVRTRISDDRLFLPYVVCDYIDKTGDKSILNVELPYLVSAPLNRTEKSRYENPAYSDGAESLKKHIERIIESAYRLGENGLLLIDGGDWNDALNDVGNEKAGESVWLSMFYYDVLRRTEEHYESVERLMWIARRGRLKRAVESCFTGTEYKRLVTKDGEWLGNGKSDFMKIDVISQAWASLSGACNKNNTNIALDTAKKELFDAKNGLILLLSPPFDASKHYGYISSYPKGIRENGGQYTHGAIWFLQALCNEGRVDEAYDLFGVVNPIERCADRKSAERYKGEPYVLAADVYSGQNAGRCGWSWYTGSAAWCYKLVLEGFFGIKLSGGNIVIAPRLPSRLNKAKITFRADGSEYTINIVRGGKKGFFENGVEIKNGNVIKIAKDECRSFVVNCL